MPNPAMADQGPELIVTVKDKVCILRFNRPHIKNCFSREMMTEISLALEEAASDPDILILVMTGTGDYFTSGMQLQDTRAGQSSMTSMDTETDVEQKLSNAIHSIRNTFHRFVLSLIDFPKPLIAVVNGHAVGIGVTMLGLCDIVYASDKATFQTPFVKLGLAPEGCSTYTFPQIMGPGKAAEMIFFGKKVDAAQACQSRLVTDVFPDTCPDQVWSQIYEWAQLPPSTLTSAKGMLKTTKKDILCKVNTMECDHLVERIQDGEFFAAMMKFFSQKSKL